MPPAEMNSVLGALAVRFERFCQANPEVPVDVLLMTLDARTMMLEAQLQLQGAPTG